MNTRQIFELRQEINKFLEEHPEYRQFQKDIEARLKSAGNSHNRMALLNMMMQENVGRLAKLWRELSEKPE
ncbi:MAG TPA: hypothetical protein PKI14_04395 [Fervidobacterium sp.]|nr:hypothetical protein [Fervidobacterium sp.]